MDIEHWLVSVFVAKKHRREKIAKTHDTDALCVQTKTKWRAVQKPGEKLVEETFYRNEPISVTRTDF